MLPILFVRVSMMFMGITMIVATIWLTWLNPYNPFCYLLILGGVTMGIEAIKLSLGK